MNISDKINQRRRQFLVHSFLFYELGEAIVPDADFDRWARELIELQRDNLDLSAALPFHELTAALDTSVSAEAMGIRGEDYPLSIKSAALHVLHRHKKSKASYETFAKKYGYALL
ncbi:DNA ligase LigA-related protein [Paenibacillus jamilae]|uniref:DNA ligase LigA-related protein n=1 Tax=Paenibacillus jamilae TaxID=114136 RepID=UPI000A490463|nr:hypothetical protein [Paenibacillus jamilae]